MDSPQKIKIGTNVPVQLKNKEGGGTEIVQEQTPMVLM